VSAKAEEQVEANKPAEAGDGHDGHPAWCYRTRCTACGSLGAHRTNPVFVTADGRQTVAVSLYQSSDDRPCLLLDLGGRAILLPGSSAKQLGMVLAEQSGLIEPAALDEPA
jgi:hypothetical protein